jgi:hypothetical protein
MGTGYTRQDVADEIADGNIVDAIPLDAEFNRLEQAFASLTGHSHDGTAGNGGSITKVGPVQDVVVSASQVLPKTTNVIDLGSNSFGFKDAYFTGTVKAVSFTPTGSVNAPTILIGAGAVGSPSLRFSDDTTTGWYRDSADNWTFVSAGTPVLTLNASGIQVTSGNFVTGGSATFSGNGSNLSGLNASNLAVGTVPVARVSGSYTNITGVGALVSGSIGSGFGNINIGSNVFTGIGSGLTGLNASNLASGTVSNSRISGAYTNFTNITASSIIQSNEFQGDHGGAADPTFTFTTDSTTGIYSPTTGAVSVTSEGTLVATFNSSGLVIHTGGNLVVNGNISGDIAASNITSGTIPDARISGSYDGFTDITASSAVSANEFRATADGGVSDPSFTFTSDQTTGFYKSGTNQVSYSAGGVQTVILGSSGIAVTSGKSFIGDGGSITGMVATELTSGTLPSARLGATAGDRNWVLARIADGGTNVSGTFAYAQAAGASGYDIGDSIAGSNLTVASANAVGTTTLSGTWTCLGYVKTSGNPQERVTMWKKQ